MKFTKEQISKAKEAKTAKELQVMAKENGVKMNEEQSMMYFDKLHKNIELSDSELNSVAGGKGEPDPLYKYDDRVAWNGAFSSVWYVYDSYYDSEKGFWRYKLGYNGHYEYDVPEDHITGLCPLEY